ncbi:tetraspanin-32 isoform X2 [Leptonychotes weddellii]|uniref:Tetraspanin n=1 Tax=Leptonychotes weddellii TaxID=9713 RepID=A0A7F8R1N6_LEPWE|nr:tetraspanin-32 isoform X2 [Leptonychotes weddellii]
MATMQPWSRVRVAKCQMLVTSFFVLLLGLSVATLAVLTYFGAHFAIIGHVSSDRTPYEAMHRWAFYIGISLAGLLTLGAVLGAAATVREAGGLMAGGFLCFALVFSALVQVAFWRFHNPTQVEDAFLDTYDLVYDRAVKNLSGTPRQQLVAIQDMFLCCGKSSPFSLLGDAEAGLCQGEQAARQVYAMLLSSFLWFAIRSGSSLDRKGKYTLSRRVPSCQPQEPSFFRRSQGSPKLQSPTDADVFHGRPGASGPSGGPRLL